MKIGNCTIEIFIGDITKVGSEAIVNAANPSLMGGGGVDGAIHRNGGQDILDECREIIAKKGRCHPGDAVITGAGKLPAKYVIHTVGPIWHGGRDKEDELLRKAYINSIKLAEEHQITSLAFPNISTGIYGYPKEAAVKEVKSAIESCLNGSSTISKLIFVCFDDENYELYQQHFNN